MCAVQQDCGSRLWLVAVHSFARPDCGVLRVVCADSTDRFRAAFVTSLAEVPGAILPILIINRRCTLGALTHSLLFAALPRVEAALRAFCVHCLASSLRVSMVRSGRKKTMAVFFAAVGSDSSGLSSEKLCSHVWMWSPDGGVLRAAAAAANLGKLLVRTRVRRAATCVSRANWSHELNLASDGALWCAGSPWCCSSSRGCPSWEPSACT